ncbi:ANKRD11_12 [Mytilus coruscus]|uniref:ANKRD11_12 n=1 Tax=Mytilus coruscus TaxID=42192 RepID=A0A6J8BFF8_MYTCO|nr:ANKRD11_12 [Mytilus coruscus]
MAMPCNISDFSWGTKTGNTNQSIDEDDQDHEAYTDQEQETQIATLPADRQVLDNHQELPLPVIKHRKKQEKPVQKRKKATEKEPTQSKANYLSKDRYHRDVIRNMEEKRDKDYKDDSGESDSILSPPKKSKYEAACNSSARLDILESEIKRLKRKVKVLENREKENLPKKEELNNISNEVQEYNGFSKTELKNLISTTTSIPTATDLLLKKLFTTDEIKSHSISVFYGKVLKEQVKKGPPDDFFDNETVRKYTMQVLYRMKGIYTGIDRTVVVQSPGNGAMCGMTLQVGQQYVIMGHRSGRKKMIRSCDFVKRTSSLSFEETFYIFTNGPYSYLKNCKDGCDDISDSSKGCHFSHENYAAIDCLSTSAVCRKERNVCKWFNNEKCPSITVRPVFPTTPPFFPRPVMRR